MSGGNRRGGLKPVLSTLLHNASRYGHRKPGTSRLPSEFSPGIAPRRVAWIWQSIVRQADSPGGSRSEPPTWSRDTAARKVIFASLPVMWSCPVGNALMFRPIFPARHRRAQWRSGAVPVPSNRGPRATAKKSRHAAEPVNQHIRWVGGAGRSPPAPHPQSPGVEPRPHQRPGFPHLTILNHPFFVIRG
jgi:hypothetical protein